MSDEVLGALISAGASIAIALINKKSESSSKARSSGRGTSATPGTSSNLLAAPKPHATRYWYIFVGVTIVWMALSPAYVHHDFAGTNFLLIPPLVILLALTVPVQPLRAAWMSLALFAANFVLGPLSNRIKGSPFDRSFLGEGGSAGEGGKLEPLLMIAAATAAIAAFICFLRLRFRRSPIPAPAIQITGAGALSTELQALARLRTEGALSEDEFRRAKEKLLGTAGEKI
jgi:hypothetical protein